MSAVSATQLNVLVTGAAGRIGGYFAEQNAKRYRLRLMVKPGQDGSMLKSFGEVVEADLGDLPALRRACEGMDACLHLAGDASPRATWDSLLPANIIGTYNLFVAALATGCSRVVYASSIHAVSGYPTDEQVKATQPVNPGDLYGVTKCFGEALARYMAGQEGMSAVAIRIGAFEHADHVEQPTGLPIADAWVSPRDLNQLIQKCIEATNVRFAIVHGLSDNEFKRLDLSNARELFGYAPVDDAFETNRDLRPLRLAEQIATHSNADSKDRAATSGLRNELPGNTTA